MIPSSYETKTIKAIIDGLLRAYWVFQILAATL